MATQWHGRGEAIQLTLIGGFCSVPLVTAAVLAVLGLSGAALPVVASGYLLGMALWLGTGRIKFGGSVPPSNLPPPPTRMIGREEQVNQLERFLLQVGTGPRIANVHGVAGIGKTAFSLYVAHRVANRFAGGELFAHFDADLDRQAAVNDALRQLVQSLQPATTHAGENRGEYEAAYRRMMRKVGRRRQLLMVLDDVPDAQTVATLLPDNPWVAVIVTSRHPVGTAGANAVELGKLETDAARRMLESIISSERVAREPAVAEQMVAAAAHHPLAIQLVGMALAIRPHTRLSVAHQRMSEERESGAAGADEFDQALNLSYAMLARGEQDALTRLGFLDQRRFAAWELAALAEIDETEAWKICDRLSDAGLVARQSSDVTGVQSFTLLEHVERYARLRCAALPARLSPGVKQRLADARVQRQMRESQVREVFERVQVIVEQGLISRAFKEARDAVALARELQDDYGEAEATAMLAELHGELGGGRDVRDLLNVPLESDKPMPRIRALRIGAKLHRRLRQVGQARQKLAEASMLNARLQDGVEAVRLLREAAIVESVGPKPKAGLRYIQQASQRLESSPASAALRAGLAYAHGRILLAAGEPRQAFDILTTGAQLAGNHQVLWRAWLDYELAKAAFGVGEQQQALGVALSALDEFNGLRHRYGAAHCRQFVGLMLYQQGRFETAIRFLGEALETFHNCGDGWTEAEAADQLALAHEKTGQTARARDLRQAAKRIRLAINAPQASSGIRQQIRHALSFQEPGLT